MNKTRNIFLSIAVIASILLIAYDRILLPSITKIHPDFGINDYYFLWKNKAQVQSLSSDSLRLWLENEKENLLLIDLRDPEEYQHKKINHSVSLPFDELLRTDKAIFQHSGKKIVFISADGQLAAYVCLKLQSEGINNLWYLEKGIDNWTQD